MVVHVSWPVHVCTVVWCGVVYMTCGCTWLYCGVVVHVSWPVHVAMWLYMYHGLCMHVCGYTLVLYYGMCMYVVVLWCSCTCIMALACSYVVVYVSWTVHACMWLYSGVVLWHVHVCGCTVVWLYMYHGMCMHV